MSMMINEAVLSSDSIAQLDADGIRLKQDRNGINDAEFFVSYDDLRDLVALADALGLSATYDAIREHYSRPFDKLRIIP
jgi:hypothetical protein